MGKSNFCPQILQLQMILLNKSIWIIVYPPPISERYEYILTMRDRYTRWKEAVLMVDMEGRTVDHAFYETYFFCTFKIYIIYKCFIFLPLSRNYNVGSLISFHMALLRHSILFLLTFSLSLT